MHQTGPQKAAKMSKTIQFGSKIRAECLEKTPLQ